MMNNFILILLTVVIVSCSNSSTKEQNMSQATKRVENDTIAYGEEYYSKYQGKWQAEKDKNFIMEIRQDSMIEYSGDEELSRSKFTLLKKCESVKDDPTMKNREFFGYFIEEEGKYECESEILSNNKNILTLMTIENGRITIFNKIK